MRRASAEPTNEPAMAVAATAADTQAPVSQYGGRAPFYMVFDGDGHLVETVANPHAEATDQAGIRVADLLDEKAIAMFVAGDIGPQIRAAFQNRNIRWFEKRGTVSTVLEEVIATSR